MKVTTHNYFNVINEIGVHKLPADLKKIHAFIVDATDNNSHWKYYETGEQAKTLIDKHFSTIEKLVEKKLKPANKSGSSSKKAAASGNPKLVRSLKEEVKFIRRFINLHNKRKSPKSILTIIRGLQKAITTKLITKDSLFAKEVEDIQGKLIRMYNSMKGERLIQIEAPLLAKCVGIAGGEQVYPSIGFIRSFINMQGNPLDLKKRDSFLTRLEKARSSKKISSTDPFHDKLVKIAKYLKSYKGKTRIEFDKAELNGLACICKACDKELGKIYDTKGKRLRKCRSKKYSDAGQGACSYNKGIDPLGKIYDTAGKTLRKCKSGKYSDAGRGACSYNKGLSGIMTAQEVASMKFQLLPFTGIFGNLIGQPEKNFSMMIHGEPGAGKSTFILKFVKYLSGFGRVLYVSSEEFGSVTLTNLVNENLNPIPDNVHFFSDLYSVNVSDYDFVILDSVNDLNIKLEDFKYIKQSNPNTGFIMVLQHTKNGQFKGGKEWEHEVQIAADIVEGTIYITKNRYGAKENWRFFDDERSSYAYYN